MNILHITATHLKKFGGIPNVLINLTEEQNQIEGVSSRVLSIKHDINEVDSSLFVFENTIKGIKEYINTYSPDVVIFHGVFFLDYILVSLFLERSGIKYYIEPHSSFNYTVVNKNKLKKEIAFQIVFKRFISKAYGYIF